MPAHAGEYLASYDVCYRRQSLSRVRNSKPFELCSSFQGDIHDAILIFRSPACCIMLDMNDPHGRV